MRSNKCSSGISAPDKLIRDEIDSLKNPKDHHERRKNRLMFAITTSQQAGHHEKKATCNNLAKIIIPSIYLIANVLQANKGKGR